MIYRSGIAHYGEGDVKTTQPGFRGNIVNMDVGLDFIMPQHVQASGVHAVNPQWDMLWV
ncbi:hypothetical protein O9992_15435 [Vibrio lentus]|nr:hypothetical protein [Vibrio lentus]